MKQAAEHIQHLYPFEDSKFPLEKYEDLTSLEMFTGRFAKLQDTMGDSLFPEFLKFMGENVSSLSMIDRLNKLEKYNILESVSQRRALRELRNDLAHEYPNSYSSLVNTLNKVFENHLILERTLDKLVHEYSIRAK